MNKRFKDAEKFSKGSAICHKEQQHEMEAAMSTERCPTCGWIPAITDPPKCERCGHAEPPASTPDAPPAIPFQFLLKRFRAAAFPSSACPEKFLIHQEHFDDFCTETEQAVSELLEALQESNVFIHCHCCEYPKFQCRLCKNVALLAKWRKEA